MSNPSEHLDIISECLAEAENEMKVMAEHSHTCDDRILKGILGMKLIASKVKDLILKQKGELE